MLTVKALLLLSLLLKIKVVIIFWIEVGILESENRGIRSVK